MFVVITYSRLDANRVWLPIMLMVSLTGKTEFSSIHASLSRKTYFDFRAMLVTCMCETGSTCMRAAKISYPRWHGKAERSRHCLQVQLVHVVDIFKRVRRIRQEVRPIRLTNNIAKNAVKNTHCDNLNQNCI